MATTGKRYYWLKLQDGFFGSKRIKKLRNLAGGDTYTIIYLKMQLLAIKNNGILEYTGLEPTFAEELALDLDEKPDNVSVAVNYLLNCGLLETADNKEFFVPYAVLNTGSEGASAKRVRDYRGRKALQSNTPVTQVKRIGNGEIEKEIDIDIEKEIEIEETADVPPTSPPDRIDYQAIKNLYNTCCPSLAKCTALSDARKKTIKARFSSGYTEEDFKTLFTKAEASSFLKGKNNRNWMANFDWLIKDANFAKVLDGNYDNHASAAGQHSRQADDWSDMDFLK